MPDIKNTPVPLEASPVPSDHHVPLVVRPEAPSVGPSESGPEQEGSGASMEGRSGNAGAPVPAPLVAPAASAPFTSSRHEELEEIESILSEGLEQEYRVMNPALQARFRQEGERVAIAIQALLAQSQKAARQILELIHRWLGLIPGVNKFFLEQEAKIKTDRLLIFKHPKDEP